MMTVITAIFHCKNVLTENVLPGVVMMMLSLLMMMMMTGFQLSVIVFNFSAKCRHHHHFCVFFVMFKVPRVGHC